MNPDCLFCKIAHNDKENLIWENDIAAAFKDINPSAETHVLVVPKEHVVKLQDLEDIDLAGRLMMAVREVASNLGVQNGYKVRINVGRSGGQIVDHLHIHILAGKALKKDIL